MSDNEIFATRRTMIRFAANGVARRRLYCVPFAGGRPAAYRLWPTSLPDDVEVVALQLPGREPGSREVPLDSIGEIVDGMMTSFDAVDPSDRLPFAMFGHSMGALIAFELTVALERSGRLAPSKLFVSGRRAPDDRTSGRSIHHLGDDDFLDEMNRRYGGVPDAVRREPELLALLLPALRADVRTFETYEMVAGQRVQCPVQVYGGVGDTNPRPDELPRWQRVCEQPIAVQLFPGDHFYLNSQRPALAGHVGRHWHTAPETAT